MKTGMLWFDDSVPATLAAEDTASMRPLLLSLIGLMLPCASLLIAALLAIHRNTGLPAWFSCPLGKLSLQLAIGSRRRATRMRTLSG